MIHKIVLVFFILLIVYSLFFNNIIEGLDNNDPINVSKTNTSDIQTLKKQLQELKSVDSQINNIDTQTKLNDRDLIMLTQKSEQMKIEAKAAQKQAEESKKKD
jgi:preprotein translocase subunit SecF